MTVGDVVDLDSLLVQCWCGQGYVWVPRAEVRACVTRSCRRPGCGRFDFKGRVPGYMLSVAA